MNENPLIEDLRLVPIPPWWQNPWVVVGALLVGAALVAGILWLLRRRRPAAPSTPVAPPGPPPEAEYLARLEALRARRDTLSAYQLAIEVSELLRGYLEARHRLPVRYQTTREFLEAAAGHPDLRSETRTTLSAFLRLCDAVKFARRPATPAELDGLLDTAGAVIRAGTTTKAEPTGR